MFRWRGHWTGSNLSHYKSSCYDNGQVQLWVTIYCHASVTDRFKPDSPFIDMWRTGSNSSHHLMPCYGDKQIQAWQVSWLMVSEVMAIGQYRNRPSCQKLPTAEYFSIKKNINTFSPFSGCFLPQLFEQQLYQLVNYKYFIMYYRTQKCKGKETRKNAFLDLYSYSIDQTIFYSEIVVVV